MKLAWASRECLRWNQGLNHGTQKSKTTTLGIQASIPRNQSFPSKTSRTDEPQTDFQSHYGLSGVEVSHSILRQTAGRKVSHVFLTQKQDHIAPTRRVTLDALRLVANSATIISADLTDSSSVSQANNFPKHLLLFLPIVFSIVRKIQYFRLVASFSN